MSKGTGRQKKDERVSHGRKRLNMWLAQRHFDELQELASYDGRSVSDVIRQIVGEFLNDKNAKAAGHTGGAK